MKYFNIIRRLILFPIRYLQFEHFDITSDYVKPMMITGRKNIIIGKRVLIREYARIEALDRYNNLRFKPSLIIEDDVSIEQGFHATCTNSLVIKKGATISSYVYVSDTSHSINEIQMSVLDSELISDKVIIGEYAFIGTGVKIMPGVSIGNNTVIGTNAVVTNDIPDNCMAVGAPARVIKRFDCNRMEWERV